MFLLVPAHPGRPGQRAVKRLLLCVVVRAFTLQLQSITALWLVLISCPAEGRRLSWPDFAWSRGIL